MKTYRELLSLMYADYIGYDVFEDDPEISEEDVRATINDYTKEAEIHGDFEHVDLAGGCSALCLSSLHFYVLVSAPDSGFPGEGEQWVMQVYDRRVDHSEPVSEWGPFPKFDLHFGWVAARAMLQRAREGNLAL